MSTIIRNNLQAALIAAKTALWAHGVYIQNQQNEQCIKERQEFINTINEITARFDATQSAIAKRDSDTDTELSLAIKELSVKIDGMKK